MATMQECRKALESLIERLAGLDSQTRAKLSDRTLSCRIPDIGVIFLTRLGPHGADPLVEVPDRGQPAQIRFIAKSDDVVAIAEDPASFAKAWITGRLKVEGSLMDLFQLRKML